MLDRIFRLTENRTTVRTEIVAGVTTFLTMAYIIFVQPAVLSAAGMDFGAVLVATCISSGIATLLMAFLANYPIAVAPAMGHNFFFAFTVVVAHGVPWRVALGAVAIAGAIFILTAGIGLREHLIRAIPESLKHAIAVGIGLLIALIGLEWGGLVVDSPGTLVTLGNLKSPPALLTLFGLLVMAVLLARRVRGAMLIGILASTLVGLATGIVTYQGVVSAPPSLAPTFMQLDVLGAFKPAMISVIFVFFFLALFDSVGTLVGVAGQAGLMREAAGSSLPTGARSAEAARRTAGSAEDGAERSEPAQRRASEANVSEAPEGTAAQRRRRAPRMELPRARQALLSDAVGTVIGAGLGTSTVTAYIESSTGVAAGGRTGLANVVTALLFFISIFLFPLVKMIGGGYPVGGGAVLYPVVAPALLLVGTLMMAGVRTIAWDDPTEAIPAFLTIVLMPLTVSITDGIAFGFIAYAVLKLVTGRGREAHALVYVFAAAFVARYVWLT